MIVAADNCRLESSITAARGSALCAGFMRGIGDVGAILGQSHRIVADRFDRRRLFGHALGEFGNIRLQVERTDAELARQPRPNLDGLRDVH